MKRLILVAFLIGIAPSIVDACSCALEPGPCGQSWRSGEIVFLGKVTAKVPADSNAYPQQFAFHFRVSENFRGPAVADQEIVIYTGSGGGDCGYPFAVGTSYLVYAFNYNGQLRTGICNPTNPALRVPAVIRQLRALRSGQPAADLFGTIGTAPKGVGFDDLIETTPLANVRVRVIGDGTAQFFATTDLEGVYSFQSLPAGTYRVEVDLPTGMSTWQRNRGEIMRATIGDFGSMGCNINVFARPDGRISGVVVDDAGKGVAGFVTLRPTDPKEAEAASRRGGLPGYETEDGKFVLWLLPPGQYRLRFHPKTNGRVDLRVPAVWSDAVDLGFGQHVGDFRFKVPRRDSPGP